MKRDLTAMFVLSFTVLSLTANFLFRCFTVVCW